MDVDAPPGWMRETYDGFLSTFNLYPPVVSYEHRESATRILAKPVVRRVPASDAHVTVAAVTERFDRPGLIPAEAKQTHWWAATQRDEVPAVFPDAPLSDGRFDDLPWRVAIQPIRLSTDERDDDFRPDTAKRPVAYFERDGRVAASETLRFVLDSSPRFGDDDPVWLP